MFKFETLPEFVYLFIVLDPIGKKFCARARVIAASGVFDSRKEPL